MSNPDPRNSTLQAVSAFRQQAVLNFAPRNLEDERLAKVYLDRKAPDLIGMVMGHLL